MWTGCATIPSVKGTNCKQINTEASTEIKPSATQRVCRDIREEWGRGSLNTSLPLPVSSADLIYASHSMKRDAVGFPFASPEPPLCTRCIGMDHTRECIRTHHTCKVHASELLALGFSLVLLKQALCKVACWREAHCGHSHALYSLILSELSSNVFSS